MRWPWQARPKPPSRDDVLQLIARLRLRSEETMEMVTEFRQQREASREG